MTAINAKPRQLGSTNIKVNPIGLGGMPLSIEGRPEEAQAHKVIEAFIERGGDFIDTANVYCLDDSDIGHNERLIYKILKSLGIEDKVVVATKGGLTRPNGSWEINSTPSFIRRSCEKSLKDLNTEIITLYQLHAIDSVVPFPESLGELIRLMDEGKIMHIGLSNVRLDQLKYAMEHTAIASVQNRCNVLYKADVRNGLIEYCRNHHISYIPYNPVGGRHGNTRLAKNPVLKRLSEKHGKSVFSIALSWLLQHNEYIIPIPGATRVESVIDSAQALSITLDPEDIEEINQLAEKQ